MPYDMAVNRDERKEVSMLVATIASLQHRSRGAAPFAFDPIQHRLAPLFGPESKRVP
jgi:hypothetical protein